MTDPVRNYFLDPQSPTGIVTPSPTLTPERTHKMSILENILASVKQHETLVAQAIDTAEAKIASAETAAVTAAETAVETSPIVLEIQAAFDALQAKLNEFLAKNGVTTPVNGG